MADSYITLSLLKAYLGITDTSRDTVLTTVISTASRGIDAACGRRFWLDDEVSARTLRTRGKTYRDGGDYVLLVPDIAQTSGLVVTGRTDVTTDYGADDQPVITRLYSGAPWAEGTIIVTARWGWPAVPDEIQQATLIYAAKLFKRKDSPEGILGSADYGVIRVDRRRDPDVQSLIDPYVLPGLA